MSRYLLNRSIAIYRKRHLLARGEVVGWADDPSDCAFSAKGTERLRVDVKESHDERIREGTTYALSRDYDKWTNRQASPSGGWIFTARSLRGGKRPVGSVVLVRNKCA